MHKIHYDRERKSLVDEVNASFSGTRVSEAVSASTSEYPSTEIAKEKALERVLEKAGEYTANAYEVVSLEITDTVGCRHTSYCATAAVIFYQSIH